MTKSTTIAQFDEQTQHNVELWLKGDYDQETKQTILRLIQDNPIEIVDAFFTHLAFGTGGLRGIMGVGTNRMNPYTVRAAAQGLANYLKQSVSQQALSVIIGYDSRHHSRLFAEEAAKVLVANGIRVYLFSALRPTPLVSFGCRTKHCSAAIMITASHNPPEYNGFKVFWDDGGQVLPPHDGGIMKEMNQIISLSQVKVAKDLKDKNITILGEEIDQAYLDCIGKYAFYADENKKYGKSLKIVYTSLHGTGITLMPKALESWGFPHVMLVDRQVVPDGDFPTVKNPNPEDKAALKLGIETLEACQGDILLATDPDADRAAVAVMHEGKVHILNGNQIASICLEHICEALSEQHRMPKNGAFIKTIGTTELFKSIADAYGKLCVDVLTGFKYIAEQISKWEKNPNGYQFIFAGEESFGYLLGTHCRDKDAIVSCALICEAALHAKRQNKTLVDLLYDLYRKYGVFVESLFSINFDESKQGKEQMRKGMEFLKKQSPTHIKGIAIDTIEDYENSTKTHMKTGQIEPLQLPKSDVLLFWMADGTKLMIRPSGTEPKIKIYCGVVRKNADNIPKAMQEAEHHANNLIEEIRHMLE